MKKIMLSMEVPVSHMEDVNPLLDLHFIIASNLKRDFEYLKKYKSLDSFDNKLRMLDNGMYEEGEPLSVEELIHYAKEIDADIVFAPDQHPDKALTLDLTKEFIAKSKEAKGSWKIGAIPQGKNVEEVLESYYTIAELDEVYVIGLSFLNDRNRLVETLVKENRWSYKWHHMLGLYNLKEIANWPYFITSMDTVKPIKAAQYTTFLEDCPRGLGKWNSSWKIQNKEILFRNIAKLHQALSLSLRR